MQGNWRVPIRGELPWRVRQLHPHPSPDSPLISAQKFEDIRFAIAVGIRRGNRPVHCLEGMSRSPIAVAACMDRCGYAGIDKALSEIAKQRDLAPARTLLTCVQGLVRKRKGSISKRPDVRSCHLYGITALMNPEPGILPIATERRATLSYRVR